MRPTKTNEGGLLVGAVAGAALAGVAGAILGGLLGANVPSKYSLDDALRRELERRGLALVSLRRPDPRSVVVVISRAGSYFWTLGARAEPEKSATAENRDDALYDQIKAQLDQLGAVSEPTL